MLFVTKEKFLFKMPVFNGVKDNQFYLWEFWMEEELKNKKAV